MGLKLKKGFFRTFPFNEFVPLTGKWTAVENDNSYGVYRNNTLVRTYSGQCYGFGKVLSLFNEEFVVYTDATGSVRYIANDGTSGVLVSSGANTSVICFDDCFIVSKLTDTTITCKKYAIAGTHSSVFVHLVGTRTVTSVSLLGIEPHLMAVKATDTIGYVAGLTDSKSVKITKGTTWTSDDFTAEKVNGALYNPTGLSLPVVGAQMLVTDTTRVLYNRNLDFYCTMTFNGERPGYNQSLDLTIRRTSTSAVVYSGTITIGGSGNGKADARVMIDNSGNGYVALVYSTSDTNCSAKLFRLANGALSQITSASASGGSGTMNGSGIMPLVNNIIPPFLMYRGGSVRKKISFTTSSITISDPTNTDTYTFGSGVLELD